MLISCAADIGMRLVNTTQLHVRKAANPSSGRDRTAPPSPPVRMTSGSFQAAHPLELATLRRIAMVGRLSVTSDIGLHDPAQPVTRPQSVRVVPGRTAFQSRPRHMPSLLRNQDLKLFVK